MLRLTPCCLLALAACGEMPEFTPQEIPPHTVELDGGTHAARYRTPFLCGDPAQPDVPMTTVTCPTDAAPRARFASCDSSGCHGSYTYTATSGVTSVRHLRGGNGPSCYTCHDKNWDDRKVAE